MSGEKKGRDAHADKGAERKIDETANHGHVLGGRPKRGVDAVRDRPDHAISKDDHDGGAHEEPGALLERLPPEPNCRSRREAHAGNLASTPIRGTVIDFPHRTRRLTTLGQLGIFAWQ